MSQREGSCKNKLLEKNLLVDLILISDILSMDTESNKFFSSTSLLYRLHVERFFIMLILIS